MHFRSPKLLKAAHDRPCVVCGSVGSTVAAHANSVALGKGTGIKCPDFYIAFLCALHHSMVDGRVKLEPGWDSPQELWTYAFLRTVAVWFNEGIVTVKGAR